MSEAEAQLGAILNNPQLMQQLMTMAKQLSAQPESTESERKAQDPKKETPRTDLIEKISNIAGSSIMDSRQQTLLKALNPYLTKEKIAKLERAMRAAKLANTATMLLQNNTSMFNNGGK